MSIPGQLTDAYLGQVWFVRNEDWEWDENTRYALESGTSAVLAHDRESARATLRAEFTWHHIDDAEQIEGPFELVAEVIGDFDWSEPEATDEDIVGWIEFNAEHLLWPYLRTYVSMITGSSGLPALTIYTISAPTPSLGALDDEQLLEQDPISPELRS